MMDEKKRPELLAPAGDPETLTAVINAGADAVYLGLKQFGARAYAKNFTVEELLEGISYAHLYGVKIYLTVNTCFKEEELPELPEALLPLYEAGLDAVLVQEMGVFSLLKRHFPELKIHASTQMGIAGAEGATLLKELGADRVVLSRELSLEEIRHIADTASLELECFCHGALCYAYSGLCLMSSLLGGRSGNRGRCAGTCRLPFSVDGSSPFYPLSLKDLCTIDILPELLEAGVHSLKIEGRMKSAEYAAGVTSIYRKYLDRYLRDGKEGYQVRKEDRRALLDLGNRSGFTEGFYHQRNSADMITVADPSHMRAGEEKLRELYSGYRGKRPVPVTGHFTMRYQEPVRFHISGCGESVSLEGPAPEKAVKSPLSEETIREKLTQTGDTSFAFSSLTIETEPDLFLPVGTLKALRRETLALLSEKLGGGEKRTYQKPEEKAQGKPARSAEPPKVAAMVSLRQQLEPVLRSDRVDTVILDSFLYERADFLPTFREDLFQGREHGKTVRLALPYVFRMETAAFYAGIWDELLALSPDEVLIRTMDELAFIRQRGFDPHAVVLDERLYAWSGEAQEMYRALGFPRGTLPLELNRREMKSLHTDEAELIVYGRIPLMITASCVRKNMAGCDHKKAGAVLTDRYKKDFPVRTDCTECLNLIFNPDVLYLSEDTEEIAALSPRSIRYSFTTETAEETARVLLGEKNKAQSYTRGHFRRGVE